MEGKVKSPHLCFVKNHLNDSYMPYIAFVGFFKEVEPSIVANLNVQYPELFSQEYLGKNSFGDGVFQDNLAGYRGLLQYEQIDYRDSLTIYLARINEQIGHLVADCPEGGWVEECFVYLDSDGMPIKSDGNWNPNPIPQLLEPNSVSGFYLLDLGFSEDEIQNGVEDWQILEAERNQGLREWEDDTINELDREEEYLEQERADHIIDLN